MPDIGACLPGPISVVVSSGYCLGQADRATSVPITGDSYPVLM